MKFISCLTIFVLFVGFLEAKKIPGGYHPVATNDWKVQSAARFAAREMGLVLVEVMRARKQVVAGTNYKLKLRLRSGGLANECTVVVWSKLDGTKELTSKKCIW